MSRRPDPHAGGGHKTIEGIDLKHHIVWPGQGSAYLCALLQQSLANVDRRAFAGVARVCLEGETEDGNLLVIDCVEHGIDDERAKTHLLVVIHLENLRPIVGDFIHLMLLAQINEVQNVLLEAAPAKTGATLEELRTCHVKHGRKDLVSIPFEGKASRGADYQIRREAQTN